MQTLTTWTDTLAIIRDYEACGIVLHVRYSCGPDVDGRNGRSRDHVTGDFHAGLSVNNLISLYQGEIDPAGNNADDRIAARLTEYSNLLITGLDNTVCWLCTGEIVGYDSDHAPCLADVEPVATVTADALEEARDIEREAFLVRNPRWTPAQPRKRA